MLFDGRFALFVIFIVVLSQSLDLEIFGHGQKGVEIVLGHVDLSVVHKVQNVVNVLMTHAPQIHRRGGLGGAKD